MKPWTHKRLREGRYHCAERLQKMIARGSNGQAFVLHIWDSQDCRINVDDPTWGQGFVLIDYITHKIGPAKRGLEDKMEWLAYVDGF